MATKILTGARAVLKINGKQVAYQAPVSIGRKPDETDAQFRVRLASFTKQLNLVHFLSKLGIKEAQALSRVHYVDDTPLTFSSQYLGHWIADGGK